MASYTKREAARLAAAGQTITEIANALNVKPSYIVQLQSDDSFKALKSELEAASGLARHSTYKEIDDNYDELERLVSTAMVENVEEIMLALSTNPIQLSKFMKDVNQLQRRSTGEQHSASNEFATVKLPAFLVKQSQHVEASRVEHNSKNEIIAVDGKTLVSMSGANLTKFAEEQSGEKLITEADLTPIERNTNKQIAANSLAANLRKALADEMDARPPESPEDLDLAL